MAKIPVPPTPKDAFNRHRTPGTLLRTQIAHLEHAVLSRGRSIRTEGEAAEYIAQLSSLIRGDAAVPPKPRSAARAEPKRSAKRSPRGK